METRRYKEKILTSSKNTASILVSDVRVENL